MRVERIGNATLYLGDCLEILPTLGKMNAVVTDPPYGVTRCEWDKATDINQFWNNTSLIISFAIEPFTATLIHNNKKYFKEKLIWEKHRAANFANAKIRHLKYTEEICVFAKSAYPFNPQMQPRTSDRVKQAQKGNSKQYCVKSDVCFNTQYEPRGWDMFNPVFKYPGNILYFPGVVSNSKEKTKHPTQKPVKLMEYLIKTYSNENQSILDPFMGSGTTGVACMQTGRKFIGIEKDKKYFEIACKRIKEAVNQ